MQKYDFIVVGGGISGLLAAYFCKKAGKKALLLESSGRLGGWLSTEKLQDHIVENGPNSILADDKMLAHFRALNLKTLQKPESLQNRFIFKSGNLIPLPLNPVDLLKTSLFSTKAKLSLLFEVFKKTQFSESSDPSIEEFFLERFHSDILHYVVDPFVSGVFAGDVKTLSMRACFPALWDSFLKKRSLVRGALSMKKEKRKILSFERGMNEWTESLSAAIGSGLHCNTKVVHLSRENSTWRVETEAENFFSDHIILATPAKVTGQLLKNILHTKQSKFLESIFYQDVLLWHSLWKKPEPFRSGLGCLIPRVEGRPLRGSLWPSEIFPSRHSGNYLLSTQYFSGADVGIDLAEQKKFIKSLLKIDSNPIGEKATLLPRSIPQFHQGHRQSVEELRKALPESLFLVGNYLDGVGLSGVFESVEKVMALALAES